MNWRTEARAALRAYPRILRRLYELEGIRVTPAYTGMPGGHTATRTTEDIALRTQLCPQDEAVITAVEFAQRMQATYPNGKERLRMMELVYFRRTHTLEGAAMECHYSVEAIKRWNNEILAAVYTGIRKGK